MRNKLIIAALYLSLVSLHVNANPKEPCDYSRNISELLNTAIPADSININCCLDVEFNPEGALLIPKIRLILNDSLSLFKYQTINQYFKGEYSSVILNKETADCLRVLLYTLYTNHKYIIKDKYQRGKYFSCDSYMWDINMELGRKKIKERRNLMHYVFSDAPFDEPYNFPFVQIIKLIESIADKLERDIFPSNNDKTMKVDWINEMFHDEYYEPCDDINSNKH